MGLVATLLRVDAVEAAAIARAKEQADAAKVTAAQRRTDKRAWYEKTMATIVAAARAQEEPDVDLVSLRIPARRGRYTNTQRAGWLLASYDNGNTKHADLCLLMDGTLVEAPQALFRSELDVYLMYYGGSDIEAGLRRAASRVNASV